MAYIIKANGEAPTFNPANGTDFTLEEMQEAVGGLIEIVYLDLHDRIMVVNEEGLLRDLPRNHVASILAKKTIVGNVIVMPSSMMK